MAVCSMEVRVGVAVTGRRRSATRERRMGMAVPRRLSRHPAPSSRTAGSKSTSRRQVLVLAWAMGAIALPELATTGREAVVTVFRAAASAMVVVEALVAAAEVAVLGSRRLVRALVVGWALG